jgi:L-ribulose-5-phosphate 3-epimerase
LKLAAISDELAPELDSALAIAVQLGLEAVELRKLGERNWIELEPAELGAAVAAARARGLEVAALAGPLFKCRLPGSDAARGALHGGPADASLGDHRALLRSAIARAAAVEVPLLRVFSCWRVPEPATVQDAIVELLEDALDAASGSGVELVLENEHDCNVATAAETAELLGRVAGLRVLWDPANHVRAGGDAGDAVPAGAAGRIAHVHLKDVDADGSWVVLGTGRVALAELLDELRAVGYDGALSFETHCELDGDALAATRASLAAVRELLGAAP